MLQYLDTLIGFAVVMAGVSLLVTAMTQFISSLLGLRGKHLKAGLATLLEQTTPLNKTQAERLSETVLHHPLISDSTWSGKGHRFFHRWKLASTIRASELLRVMRLLDQRGAAGGLPPALSGALGAIDKQNMEEWFNASMDRVSQRFAQNARVWTVVFALLTALVLHLDSFDLLRRISGNPEMRAKLVATADSMQKIAEEAEGSDATVEASLEEFKEKSGEIADKLGEAQLDLLPPLNHFTPWPDYSRPKHLLGILTSAVLLSLGAPFWFNTLTKLMNLRTVLAQKEKDERVDLERE